MRLHEDPDDGEWLEERWRLRGYATIQEDGFVKGERREVERQERRGDLKGMVALPIQV